MTVDTLGVHGPAVPKITIEDMISKGKMLSLDDVRTTLAQSEPLSEIGFPVSDRVKFRLDPAWAHGLDTVPGDNLVAAFVSVDTQEFQLSKDAALEATSICGIPKGYAARTPARLIEPQLNYWFGSGLGDKEYKLLAVNDHGKAFTRATINPFSNLRLLERALDGIEERYGKGEVVVDAKFAHSLRQTDLRIIVPENVRAMERTGTDADTWSAGIQIKNSLIGDSQTSIDGYLFRYWCSNGAIDTSATSGVWSRKSGGQGNEVYEWARSAVDDVLGGLEHSFDRVQELVDIPIQGEVVDVLRAIFRQYRIPAPQRSVIIENMAEATELNMYTVMNAVTAAANTDGLAPGHVEDLLRAGGDLANVSHDRCVSCHRLSV